VSGPNLVDDGRNQVVVLSVPLPIKEVRTTSSFAFSAFMHYEKRLHPYGRLPVCFQWFLNMCKHQFLSDSRIVKGYISHEVSLVHVFELCYSKIISNSNQPRGIVLSKDFIMIVNIVLHHHLSKEGISIGQVYDSLKAPVLFH
jgi:hypothetical protein